MSKEPLIEAAKAFDWHQVILNGGPPCFHLEQDERFCGRAERWAGHGAEHNSFHRFVSLTDLMNRLLIIREINKDRNR